MLGSGYSAEGRKKVMIIARIHPSISGENAERTVHHSPHFGKHLKKLICAIL